jgi:YbgC/YbaW family acyl-CoA thioester hydrolase
MSDLSLPFAIEVDVRGYEIDSWGHVNNAVYLQWLELARWELFRNARPTLLDAHEKTLPMMRYVDLDFRMETLFGDRIRIGIWPRSVGNTSITLGGYVRVLNPQDPARHDKLALVSKMVLACVRPGVGKVPVPAAWKSFFPPQDPGSEPPLEV